MILQKSPVLPDDYFIAGFIASLKPHIKPFVEALNPLTLDDVIHFARLQEEATYALRSSRTAAIARPPLLPTPGNSQKGGVQSVASGSVASSKAPTSGFNYGSISSGSFAASVAKPFSQSFKPTKVIYATERADKIAKGLCYFYDQPYERGHSVRLRDHNCF